MIIPPENSIIISPIGEFETELLDRVRSQVNRIFGYETETVPLLQGVGFALDSDRSQYHSTPILEKLDTIAPLRAIKVLAITKVDLFIPILTHVYGEAQLGGRACIISTHRLEEGLTPMSAQKTFFGRVVKEAVHELGHTFKLRHCHDTICIMHYSRSVRDVDQKSDQLCRYCRVLIEDEKKRLAEQNPPARERDFRVPFYG